jgi:hypothetical protein
MYVRGKPSKRKPFASGCSVMVFSITCTMISSETRPPEAMMLFASSPSFVSAASSLRSRSPVEM